MRIVNDTPKEGSFLAIWEYDGNIHSSALNWAEDGLEEWEKETSEYELVDEENYSFYVDGGNENIDEVKYVVM